MTLKECIPASSTLLYHRAIARRAASFMVFLEKIIRREWHKPYAFLMSGYSSNRIAALCFCFSVHLSADLKSEILHSLWRELPLDGQIWIILFDRTRIPIIQIEFLNVVLGVVFCTALYVSGDNSFASHIS